jgi:hypothetical protein
MHTHEKFLLVKWQMFKHFAMFSMYYTFLMCNSIERIVPTVRVTLSIVPIVLKDTDRAAFSLGNGLLAVVTRLWEALDKLAVRLCGWLTDRAALALGCDRPAVQTEPVGTEHDGAVERR